jgi:PRC-barrel domain
MTAPIEDVSSLPGKKISDQEEVEIGEVKDVYATDDGFPMWVAVETGAGIGDKRTVFVPLARLKDEDGELRVPYSKSHILESPEVDVDDHISEECDQTLRGFYAIGVADQELWTDNKSYATLVPDETGSAKRAENVDELDTPDADKRSEETMERIKNPGSSEMRDVSADDVAAESGTAATGDKKGDQDDKGDEGESGPEGKSDPEAKGDTEGKGDQEGTREEEGKDRED